jgi:4-hydroxythreonine-4-phosphate dehydrogenase
MKKIFITGGDPRGIGSEIILKSLGEILESERIVSFIPIIIGDENIIEREADKYEQLNIVYGDSEEYAPGNIYCRHVKSSKDPGIDSLSYIDKAVELCRSSEDSALVTAPVIKDAIAKIKKGFIGHTEYLAQISGKEDVVMSFISKQVRMSLLTTHVPLKSEMKKWFGIKSPRSVICWVKPHAGEAGFLGREEKKVFIPAVEKLKSEGISISGPVAPNEALKITMECESDFLVSPYHDQLLTALKMFLGPTVNFTMGLDFIRTSPDHGPAIDIAGKKPADHRSMKAAIGLAVNLIKERND